MADVKAQLQRRFQHLLDKTAPHGLYRWIGFAALIGLYLLRVYFLGGFYIVTYGLGIYLLNLFIGFITPPMDPEGEGPLLPRNGAEEFKPFRGRVGEFSFWYSGMKATVIAMGLTLFSFFDIPVFWPILLVYFVTLLALTMRNQIAHMIKYRYVPFSWGKAKYAGKGKKPAVDRPLSSEPRFNPANVK